MVQDVEFLLPVKFCDIPYCRYRGEFKVNNGQTDGKQTRDHNRALEPSLRCTKNESQYTRHNLRKYGLIVKQVNQS